MRQILSDSQQNPQALMDHMKNPMVSPHHSTLSEEVLTRGNRSLKRCKSSSTLVSSRPVKS
jgi:hypothetical protein